MRLIIKKTTLRTLLVPVTILIFFNLLHLLQVKAFDPWPQVTMIWTDFRGLLDYSHHFHFYRLVVASPGLWLEERWPGHGFSAYASGFLLWSSLLFSKIQVSVSGRKPQLWAWALLIILFSLMNGRGTIGWTGWLLVVSTCLSVVDKHQSRLAVGTMLRITAGLLLASVSSGIFVYSFMIFAYFWVFRSGSWTSNRYLSYSGLMNGTLGISLLLVSLYFVVDQVFWAIERVIVFYGGGVEGLLGVMTHGIANRFEQIGPAHFLLLFIVVVAALLFFVAGYSQRIGGDLVMIITITLAGGVFGITILTLAIPLVIVATGKLFYFRVRGGLSP